MITAEDTSRRIPGLANVRISGKTVRNRLRESGLRARRPVVGPILKQCHKTARLAGARARRRWRLHTWQYILLVMNAELYFVLSTDVVVCAAGVGNVLRTSVRTSPEVLWSGLDLS